MRDEGPEERSREARRGRRTKSAWLLVVPFLVFARPDASTLSRGAALATLGLLLRAWAAGTIRKDEVLAVTGPYAFLRHPLYVGSSLIGLGLASAGGHWLWTALVVGFFAAFYRRTVADERRRLGEIFGSRYAEYAARVPALVPRLTPYRPSSRRGERVGRAPSRRATPPPGFAWSRYRRNREWEALLGAAAAFGALAAKLRWPG